MQKCPQCKMRKVENRTVLDDKGNVTEVTTYCTNCQSVVRLHKRRKKKK